MIKKHHLPLSKTPIDRIIQDIGRYRTNYVENEIHTEWDFIEKLEEMRGDKNGR